MDLEEDDFESQYADQLEMMKELEGFFKNILVY